MFKDMGSKMIIFQNKKVRERWIVGRIIVWLGALYIEPSM